MAEQRKLPAFAIGQPLRGPPPTNPLRPTGAQTYHHHYYQVAEVQHPQSEVGLTYEDDPDKLESDLMSFNDEFTDYFKNRHKPIAAGKAERTQPLQSLPVQLASRPQTSKNKEVRGFLAGFFFLGKNKLLHFDGF